METKAFIKDYVRKNIVNHKVDFGNDAFKVKGFKVHQAKHTIRRDEFDDYGVDPDTQSFITIEFWDSANEIPVTDDFVTAFVDNYKSQTAASGGKCPVHADGNNRMNIIVSLIDYDDQVIAGWRNM